MSLWRKRGTSDTVAPFARHDGQNTPKLFIMTAMTDNDLSIKSEDLSIKSEPYKSTRSDLFDCGTYIGSHIGKEIRHSIGDYLPAHKPWVGLTDEEKLEVAKHNMLSGLDAFAKAIEAKLKEKNT
jgi:hypothetical protein